MHLGKVGSSNINVSHNIRNKFLCYGVYKTLQYFCANYKYIIYFLFKKSINLFVCKLSNNNISN